MGLNLYISELASAVFFFLLRDLEEVVGISVGAMSVHVIHEPSNSVAEEQTNWNVPKSLLPTPLEEDHIRYSHQSQCSDPAKYVGPPSSLPHECFQSGCASIFSTNIGNGLREESKHIACEK